MTDFLAFTIFGVVTGAIYAVAASGLVVTYTTSGIFNFSHGAVGMLAAFTYWQLRFDWGWNPILSLIIVLVVLAPLLGALVERIIMRGLQGTTEVTKTVVSVGLLVAFIGLAQVLWESRGRRFDRFFGNDAGFWLFDVRISWHQVLTLCVALAVALGLRLFLNETRTGTAMRAVVGNRSLAELNGARPNRASMLSWAIGFSLAALAGILLAPVLQLNIIVLTFLVVNAYAAAMVGRLRSLPWTFAGGIILGLVESHLLGWLDPNKYSFLEGFEGWIGALRPAVPVIMLFVVLLILPSSDVRGHAMTRLRESVPRPQWRSSFAAAVGLVVGVALLAGLIGDDTANLGHLSRALGLGVVMLSIVPLTGYGGQMSLTQMGFAGLGALVASKWHIGGPLEDLFALVACFVVVGAVGAVVALPALRLRGIYLALATFAFAVFLDRVVFVQSWAYGGGARRISRFEFPGLSVEGDASYAIFLAVMFAIIGLGVVAVRRGPFGRRLQAMKDSPAACATLGIDLTRTKLWVFAMSAGIAGVGGALIGAQQRAASAATFDPTQSLVVLLMAVAGGVAMVSGALVGGALLASFPFWVQIAPESLEGFVTNIVLIAPGLIGINLGRNPNGLVAEVSRQIRRQQELISTRKQRRAEPVSEPAFDPETLGLDRPFTSDDVEAIDEYLDIGHVSSRWGHEGPVSGVPSGQEDSLEPA